MHVHRRNVRAVAGALLVLATAALAGCEPSDPVGIDVTELPSVVLGRVDVAPTASAPTPDLAGITVTAEGSSTTATTGADGVFRVEAHAPGGHMTLRFRRGPIDAVLELSGLPPGALVSIDVALDGGGAVLTGSRTDGHLEFEGIATLVSLTGETPARTLRVEVAGRRPATVDVLEASTVIDREGDFATFDALIGALETDGLILEIEGEGAPNADGVVEATSVKAETDGDDDVFEDDEFEGVAALVSLAGDAPDRALRVDLLGSRPATVDILEGATEIDPLGDFVTFEAILDALDTDGLVLEIEGRGVLQDDGSFVATRIKAENDDHGDDDDHREDHPGRFEGTPTLVGVDGDSPDRRIRMTVTDEGLTVDVVVEEGVTSFDHDGDIRTFAALLAALEVDGLGLEVEGDGTLSDDGTVLATEIDVEVEEADGEPDGHANRFRGLAGLLSSGGSEGERSLVVAVEDEDRGSVQVHLLEALVRFDDSGDYVTFDSVLAALEAGAVAVELEGEGIVQSDGAVVAVVVRAEIAD